MNDQQLYFIRHGIAADRQDNATDEERPLTSQGERKTRKIAKQLHQLKLQFDLILTSPLVRARQTAEILMKAKLSTQLEESVYLAPEGDFQDWLTWLESWRGAGGKTLALVGHQPDLANWAETLIWGEAKQALILKKAGVMGLSLPEAGSPVGRSLMFLLTPPKFLLK